MQLASSFIDIIGRIGKTNHSLIDIILCAVDDAKRTIIIITVVF
ncbi:MAG: hypothetical protein ACTS5A_00065 [Candidatus Hodgkinia cicadicola]